MKTVLALFIVFLTTPALALVSIPKTYDQLVEESEHVLVGTVTSMESRTLESGAIVTDITLADLEYAKGDHDGDTYTVRVTGGTVGDLTMTIPGAPTFEVGWRYLLFVKGNGHTMFPFVGVEQGMFSVRQHYGEEGQFLYNAHGDPVMSLGRNAPKAHTRNNNPVRLEAVLNNIRNRVK